MVKAVEPANWMQLLNEVSRRNAGRRTRLEIADPEIGAQWAEVDLPLRGVAYDPRDERVEVMVGDMGSYGTHLTHSIADVRGLDLLAGADGRDSVLRISHGDGQTLLRLFDPEQSLRRPPIRPVAPSEAHEDELDLSANLAIWDRALRILLGAFLLYLGWGEVVTGGAGTVLKVVGFFVLAGGVVGWSFFYTILGISTRKAATSIHLNSRRRP